MKKGVVIDAEDTDALCLSLYATTQIPIPINIYQHGKSSKIILQLHFFTGVDCTSSFFDHGK